MSRWLCCILLSACVATSFAAVRCGNALILPGDAMSKVSRFCGKAAEENQSVVQLTYIDRWGYRRDGGEQLQTEWIYNFGAERFMVKIRFVDGVITQITDLDYGH